MLKIIEVQQVWYPNDSEGSENKNIFNQTQDFEKITTFDYLDGTETTNKKMDEENNFDAPANPAQVGPSRGLGLNRNRGRSNAEKNLRNRSNDCDQVRHGHDTAQVRPSRGLGQNRNRGRANAEKNLRSRSNDCDQIRHGQDPAQVRPSRGLGQNRNRGRSNAEKILRNRSNDCDQVRHGQGFQKREGTEGFRPPRNPDPIRAKNHNTTKKRNDQQNNRNNRTKNANQHPRLIDVKEIELLEELAQADKEDIIGKLNQKKDTFFELIDRIDTENNTDLFMLLMEIVSKLCQSGLDELKLKFLLEICNSCYIAKLRCYLMDLPYMIVTANTLYWKNQQQFWTNFVTFCESIIRMSPSTALSKCRSLIDGTSKCCLEALNERHNFVLPEEYLSKLAELRERLTISEKKRKDLVRPRVFHNTQENDEEPPENFRQLSVLPRREDLLERHPYLRSNVVTGGYRDVEHYLDVQFRLLREDCLGPLRDGVTQFVEDPNRKKYDNIRVFSNVKFVMPYVSNSKVGSLVQLDDNTTRRLKKINWDVTKRFIFGSLLLFTKDNCRSFLTATILDREPNLLSKGQIPVSIKDNVAMKNLYNGESYVMIESEVYFEPYYHVLKALQDPRFPEHIAMSKYIINVDPEPNPPAYLHPESVYTAPKENSLQTKFKVLNGLTWPSADDLELNASQYEAYKLALTHEFAVIQGPPGTGKTFIGVKVATTLLKNRENVPGPMLVICYTNHALDQFLEAILPVTESIARIGGQSRNEAMNAKNLTTLRRRLEHKDTRKPNPLRSLFYEKRQDLRQSIEKLQQAQERIHGIEVIRYGSLQKFVPESRVLGRYYASHRAAVSDPLEHWLFELMEHVDFEMEESEEDNFEAVNFNADDTVQQRDGLVFDDLEMNEDEDINFHDQQIEISFSIKNAEKKLKSLKSEYKRLLHSNLIFLPQNKEQEILVLKSRLSFFKIMYENRCESGLQINDGMDLSRVSLMDRWSLYFRWANIVTNHVRTRIQPLQNRMESANRSYEEVRMQLDVRILKGIEVIGMTTSGAARLRMLLEELAPPIVIVEEAAEVLEQHIVTSLTKDCQHLILIGDHQQLRPSAACMKLARHYNIEISLFERMINNGIHSRRLDVQHRMRPEIAALISPHIYERLDNHPSVEHFPSVRGIIENVFFFTHNQMEERVDDSTSRCNKFEAEMTLRLANYLMQQGYKPEDITILAAYAGQMSYMTKQRTNFQFLKNVKITVVDNYQGEESKIIVLSLVRNNSEDKIGFLGTENRVCVALSRAREGFYIIGNIGILKRNSGLWMKIAETLQNNASLGTAIMLQCENHPDQITTISTLEDFNKAPEGGCLAKCEFIMKCGHQCPLVCHGYDRDHFEITCDVPCERKICDQHPCPLRCASKCKPCECKVLKTLPCGHTMSVPCHMDPADESIKCTATSIAPVTLPDCQHEVKIPCHMKIETAKCPKRCRVRLEKCGHECKLTCHVNDDPDHEMYRCKEPCPKAKNACTANLDGDRGYHQCPKKCHETCDDCNVLIIKKRQNCKHSAFVPCKEDVDKTPCKIKCARMLDCGHFCKKKCFEPCGDCEEKIIKVIPDCNHEIATICKNPATHDLCRHKCERILSCGHRCTDRCDKPCDPMKCNEVIPIQFDSPCGHKVMLPCKINVLEFTDAPLKSSTLLKYCKAPCNQTLDCGHTCAGTCSSCHQGRLHTVCTQTCHQMNICGHQCKEPCDQACQPCMVPCEIKCPHARCGKQCGVPCMPCKKQCKRACKHGACSKRCGEPCNWPPCDEPCDERLACGHPCRGLCGEPCPDICKICNPDDCRLKDLLGDDIDDDAKFVKLQDCPHALDVASMDNLMKGDTETVSVRSCPFCRKPIINTYRYKDLINKIFNEEIIPVKLKVHGRVCQIKLQRWELQIKMSTFLKDHKTLLDGNKHLLEAFIDLETEVKTQKKASLLKLKMQNQHLNILNTITECYQEYKSANLTELSDEFHTQIKILCRVLRASTHKISQHLQRDIGNELKRMNSILQLSRILSHDSYRKIKTVDEVVKAVELAESYVLTWQVYEEDKAVDALEKLQKLVNFDGIESKQERDLIVKFIGSKAGSWYKCPNGHVYSFAGRAMVERECTECGAAIRD